MPTSCKSLLYFTLIVCLITFPACGGGGGGGGGGGTSSTVGTGDGGGSSGNPNPPGGGDPGAGGGEQGQGSLFDGADNTIAETGSVTSFTFNNVVYDTATGEILLTLDSAMTAEQEQQILQLIESHGGEVVGQLPAANIVQLRFPLIANIEAFLMNIREQDGVDSAGFNQGVQRLATNPNPSTFSGDYWLDEIELPEAWDLSIGNPDVLLGLVDSEVVTSSGHFGNLTITNVDVIGSAQLPIPDPHGTKMAGLMLAPGNDAFGGAGPVWLNSLYVADVGDKNVTTAHLAVGIMNAADAGADVIYVPWGPSASSNNEGAAAIELKYREFRRELFQSLVYAKGKGALLVFPVGNENVDEMNSATVVEAGLAERQLWAQDIILVGATNDGDSAGNFPRTSDLEEVDDIKWYNNILHPLFNQITTSTKGSNTGAMVDLVAPGENVTTTNVDGTLTLSSGTSCAGAMVAGVAALVLSLNPGLEPHEVKGLLKDSATDLGVSYLGKGKVNAFQALSLVNPVQPSFDDLQPQLLSAGEQFTITGSFFQVNDITLTVTGWDGMATTIIPVIPDIISETLVTATAPAGMVSGLVSFTTGALQASQEVNIRLRIAVPSIVLNAFEDVAFSHLMTATGGLPPYTWNSPSGLGLSYPPTYSFNPATQLVTGTTDGDKDIFQIVIQVMDSDTVTQTTSQTFFIDVGQRLDIDSFTPNPVPVSSFVTITGDLFLPDPNNPPVVSMTVQTDSGPVLLTPTIVNNETLTVTMPADVITGIVSLVVGGVTLDLNGFAPVIFDIVLQQTSSTALPDAQVGVLYAPVPLTGIGGNGILSYQWSGAFPGGMSIDTDGLITGTPGPGTDGNYNIDVSLSDGTNITVVTYTLTVQP